MGEKVVEIMQNAPPDKLEGHFGGIQGKKWLSQSLLCATFTSLCAKTLLL